MITETVFRTDTLALTVTRELTQAEKDRYADYLADKARYAAALEQADKEYADKLLASLGERAAMVADIKLKGFELAVTIVGKTAEDAEAEARAYAARYEGKLPRFGRAQRWHQLFRVTGTRRESI